MEIKEAIEQLSILQRWIKERHAWYEALNMAISALEKQVEKKPYPDDDNFILVCLYCGSGEYFYNLDENEN